MIPFDLNQILSQITIPQTVLYSLSGIFIILIAATGIIALLKMLKPGGDVSELISRVQSWWVMVFIFTAALVISKAISIIFFAFLSFLALKEYFSIIPTRRTDRGVLFWAYLTIPVQYYWIYQEWYGMFIIFIPVYAFLFLPMRMLLTGETKDFLRSAGILHWGVMTAVFSIGHLGYLLILPSDNNPAAGGAGLVLYLVFLTQFNDVLQFVWGKMLGRHKIVPAISPKKTWEGFLGGVLTTTLLAYFIHSYLTPFNVKEALFSGFFIAAGGFVGDIIISAIKRDLGIKDSGSILPGHGGILDRIDSLFFTTPLFFHFTYYLYY
ncbi:MAG: phosphatidate cytidylyltransferase [Spirochaetia bacterium]|nr:phosphatidate cytidylyltransferase [Spirochaetia bacterium]